MIISVTSFIAIEKGVPLREEPLGDAVFLNVDRRVMVGGFNSKSAIFRIILKKSREGAAKTELV